MLWTLDTILLVAIITNLVKGGELLLLPNQRVWLEDKIDTIAIKLDDFRPLVWETYVKSTTTHALIVGFGLAATSLWIVYKALSESDNSIITDYIIPLSVAVLFINMILFLVIRKWGASITVWILGRGTAVSFLIRINVFIFGSPILLLAGILLVHAYVFLGWVLYGGEYNVDEITDLGLLTNILFAIPVGSLVGLGIAWFSIYIFLALSWQLLWVSIFLKYLLAFLRGFTWRVATYAKGGYAALLLIITIVLGLLRLALSDSTV